MLGQTPNQKYGSQPETFFTNVFIRIQVAMERMDEHYLKAREDYDHAIGFYDNYCLIVRKAFPRLKKETYEKLEMCINQMNFLNKNVSLMRTDQQRLTEDELKILHLCDITLMEALNEANLLYTHTEEIAKQKIDSSNSNFANPRGRF